MAEPGAQGWIVLVGLMGAGKSVVGRALAARLDLPFVDSDAAIEEAARMTVSEIFAQDGEAFFRARESEVLARLLAGPPGILATGGGVFASEANRAAIRDAGAVSVWLEGSVDLLWSRVRGKAHRPLLDRPDAKARLAALHAARAPSYALADAVIPGEEGRSIGDTALAVERAVRRARPELLP
ncbi:shikimate kinase [Hasllibacter halocynthiae]|uniref:Shikimate kinase n=1 Tax=Hasllibacter halocynthiae TaxID=595589 RepID=A0A2T0X8R5_9RHOB|nr:shikimate kinase [Hasllibacter halocynthiae]PRY95336.1 shikimate kinase [Hasllibacter halocynthiae]